MINNKHQNDKPLLISQHMTVFNILFWFLHDQQGIKKVKSLLLAHADTLFTSAVKTEQSEVVPLYIRFGPINNGTFVLWVYRQRLIMLEGLFFHVCLYIHIIISILVCIESKQIITRYYVGSLVQNVHSLLLNLIIWSTFDSYGPDALPSHLHHSSSFSIYLIMNSSSNWW